MLTGYNSLQEIFSNVERRVHSCEISSFWFPSCALSYSLSFFLPFLKKVYYAMNGMNKMLGVFHLDKRINSLKWISQACSHTNMSTHVSPPHNMLHYVSLWSFPDILWPGMEYLYAHISESLCQHDQKCMWHIFCLKYQNHNIYQEIFAQSALFSKGLLLY